MRRRSSPLGFMTFVACGLLVAAHAAAQEPVPAELDQLTDTSANLRDLLDSEESGGRIDYDPEDRRDPFKSLLAGTEQRGEKRVRPPGIPGLLIDELTITGIFRTPAGFVVQVQSAEKEKSFLLKQGDQLFDGDVVQIAPNQVVFKQIIQDPTALKPFREVVKTLKPQGA